MVNKLFLDTKDMFRLLVLMLSVALLASCSHVKRDGPPNFYVDETKVPNAVPKKEPLAKYGNMNSYRVFGQRYHVMKSSKHYDQVGTASWYGTKFHARRTSSGEPYNILGMTAAHKTLPLPTYVEVTNLKNNRKIIVKVNDRGPFASNRIIDLSYVAAKKLGMIGHGTTHVRVKAIDLDTFGKNAVVTAKHHPQEKTSTRQFVNVADASKTKSPASSSPMKSGIYIQAGAFKSRSYAEKLKGRLTSHLDAPINISNSKQLYRVQIGPMKDMASAKEIQEQLKTLGI